MADSEYPAGWYDDPMGRGDERYYDGTAWTDQMRVGGITHTDAIEQLEEGDDTRDPTDTNHPIDLENAAELERDETVIIAAPHRDLASDETIIISASQLDQSTPVFEPAPALEAIPVSVAPGAVETEQPTASETPGSAPTSSAANFLDSLGSAAHEREVPELPLALGGVGGVLLGAGIVALIGQSGSQGAIIGGAVVAFAIAMAAALKLLGDQPWLRTAATGCASISIFAFAGALTLASSDVGDNAPGTFLLIAGVLHLIAWFVPGFRGRPLMLGGGIVAAAFGLSLLVAGGECDRFSVCNPLEEAASEVGLSTGAGIAMVVFGLGFLFAVYKLDSHGYRGTAETVAAAAIVTLVIGAFAMAADLSSVPSSLFVVAVGLGLGIIGHRGERRAMTWTGAGLVAGGVISLVTTVISSDDTSVGALVLIVVGTALIGIPRFVQMKADEKANETVAVTPGF